MNRQSTILFTLVLTTLALASNAEAYTMAR